MYQDETATKIIKRQSILESNRSTWENHWFEIDELVAPSPNYFHGNNPTPGRKNNDKIFDVTATGALNRFIAAMSSTLTPRVQRWHTLSNPQLKDNHNAQLYLEQVCDILFSIRYNPKSNFASQIDECYRSLGKFGTACLLVDDELGQGIRYKAIHLSEVFISENASGIVDTVYRKFKYTARQAQEAWGEENLPDKINQCAKDNPDEEFWFIHAVSPNTDEQDMRYFAFKSYYVAADAKKIVSEGGYRKMPYIVSRYITEGNEVYGRSPAMDVLPEIKTLNRARRAVLKQTEKAVDPVLLATDDAAINGLSLQAGAINYGGVDEQGRQLVVPLQTNARIDVGIDQINQMRQAINEAFLVTLFQVLVQDRPQQTATEVEYRQQEKGEMLAPTMGRQQSELLSPMIDRELDILSMAGILPPMPQELLQLGGEFEITFEAPLNKIMRSNEAIAILNTLQTAAGMAQFDPSILQMFDIEEAMRILADIRGVPAKIMHSKEEVAAMKQQQAQQAQMQQLLQAAPVVASSAKDMAQAQQYASSASPAPNMGVSQ
jgi:hypothetical protein